MLPHTTKLFAFEDFSKGPLHGKNMFIPFLIHYSFPSLQAKSGERHDFRYHFSMYYINDVRYQDRIPDFPDRRYETQYIHIDYESWVLELGFAYNIFNNLQIGTTKRLFSFYGGFLDPTIEGFHHFFGLPMGGRQVFLQNQIYINIPNDNGITLFLDKPVTAFGDIDLWGKWTFLENRSLSLAAMGAFKLPTGRLESLTGSGYPDAALGLLMDFRANPLITLYTQAGVVLPFNRRSHTMFNGLLGVELHPWSFLSFVLQMDIKTSPIRESTLKASMNNRFGTNFYQYSLPQTNILGGIVLQHKGFRWQIYFEQDSITNQGADITFSIMFAHTINLKQEN